MSGFDKTLWTRLPQEKPTIFWGDLEDAGYPFVDTGMYIWEHGWANLNTWCQREIGEDRYTWIGERFWFLDTGDATRFSLVWT